MNRRKFLGLFGAGAVAAPVVAKSASEPKPVSRGYGATAMNTEARGRVGTLEDPYLPESYEGSVTRNHGVSNREDLKEILMAENYPPNGNIEEWYAECLIKGLRENIK